VLVLDQPQLGQEGGQLGVGGLVGLEQPLDARVVAAHHPGGAGQLVQLLERPGRDAEQRAGRLERRPRPDPQLAVDPVGEEGRRRAVHDGRLVEHGAPVGLQDEDGVRLVRADQVGELGRRRKRYSVSLARVL
jgi:hypothetical protein